MSEHKERRISDHVQKVAWKDVPASLDKRRQRILSFMQRVKAETEQNDENILFFQCLAKACELVELFSKAWGTHIPLGSVATRCLLELDLLVRLFEQEPASRMKFYYSALWEEKQEVEAFLSLDPSSSLVQPLRERLEELNEIERRHNLSYEKDSIKHLNWSKLAKRFNVKKTDYETIYRRSSRMLHITPSSVLVVGNVRPRSEEESSWNLLLLMTQGYLDDLFQRVAGLLGLKIGK